VGTQTISKDANGGTRLGGVAVQFFFDLCDQSHARETRQGRKDSVVERSNFVASVVRKC